MITVGTWQKSSYSKGETNCVEALVTTPSWHKSSYSKAETNCVEVAEGVATAVRDTQNRELGHLAFGAAEWTALVDSLKQHP
ncbi:DUF397 domain-containing protein [Nocardiopsis sp. NRRL B-16309]|uniref:DUF397 domain-containing protein n=1 Tax=Nocardiopsis sp. NRRL B-16309 TaxID=1519494 RepID=UPI0006ADAC5C|nr:DUF397 domain-containing protein [Nocardiopsis sp. NRRL B-16309]KOX17112.1 hypothetical protein ADL05_11280 [Nocardiopsis sp. NRRL B-16309]